MSDSLIEFHLDGTSGVSPYQQIVKQVRHALRLGLLKVGDQRGDSVTAILEAQGLGKKYRRRWAFDEPGAWVLSNDTVKASGAPSGAIASEVADCGPGSGKASGGPKPECLTQLAAADYRQHVEYQPASP